MTLHGIYCDPSIPEEARLNALSVAEAYAAVFTASIKSDLIERHSTYLQKGERERHLASQQFFGKLGMLQLLGDSERHTLIVNAAKNLLRVHQAYDNFYNEPPFAERLLEITAQVAVPPTAKEEYVKAVITCRIGNQYGTSNAAVPVYERMIRSFTPAEIESLFDLAQTQNQQNLISVRLNSFLRCKREFKALLEQISERSVPVKYKTIYENWKK